MKIHDLLGHYYVLGFMSVSSLLLETLTVILMVFSGRISDINRGALC